MRNDEKQKKMIIMAFTFILSRRKWVSHVQTPHKCWSFVFGAYRVRVAYVRWSTSQNGLTEMKRKKRKHFKSVHQSCVVGSANRAHAIIGHENGPDHIVSGTMCVLTRSRRPMSGLYKFASTKMDSNFQTFCAVVVVHQFVVDCRLRYCHHRTDKREKQWLAFAFAAGHLIGLS